DDGVHALPPLASPVDVLQIEPESELVEGDRSGRSIHHRGELGEDIVLLVAVRLAGADLDQPEVAAAEQPADAEDQVVDVASAETDVAKGTHAAPDSVRDPPRRRERGEEGDRGEEEALSTGVVGEVP